MGTQHHTGKKNKVCIIPLLIFVLLTTCTDRKRSNPFDPEVDLDAWAPSDLQVFVISDSEIKLTWTQEYDQISGFRIERKANSESFSQIAEVDKDATEYIDTGLNYGTDYTYRVKAFTDVNESDYATSNTTNTSFPSPSNLVATPLNDTDIQLTWSDNCGFESGYRLERSDGGSSTQIAELEANVTEYTDTGLNYGTDYTYRVKAFSDVNESNYSSSITTSMSIPTPSNFVGTAVSDSEILLVWSDNCVYESGYRLERSTDGGSFDQIAEIGENITEYTDTGLTLDTDYTYRVKAYTDNNESGYATSNTTNTSFPSPSNLVATPLNDTDIQLVWSDNCDFESGYRLERSDGGSFTQIAELEANVTEYTDTGLTLGIAYTYKVKAFTDANESDYWVTTVNFWQDCFGVWGGIAVEDCNGDCEGTAIENECGCIGGNTGLVENFCYGCTDPAAINFDPNSLYDDGSCEYPPFYEDFSDLSDWYNVSGWFTITSNGCVENQDGSDGTCAKYYLPNYDNNPAPMMERDVLAYAGQTLSFYIYTDWGVCTELYLNDILVWSQSIYGYEYPEIDITQSGTLNIKFISCTGALTRNWLDELRIE